MNGQKSRLLASLLLILTLLGSQALSSNIHVHLDQNSPQASSISYNSRHIHLDTITPNDDQSNILTKIETKLKSLLPASTSSDFSHINLDLSDNRLEHFPISLFKQMPIKVLNFSHNQLTRIESDTFTDLDQLAELQLSHNRIEAIDPFAFSEHSRHLLELDLSNNAIMDSSIEFLLFASMPNLKVLNLDNNRLTMFSSQLTLNFNSLERLSLKANNLRTFDIFQLGQNNKLLMAIDISFNINLRFENIKAKVDRNERPQEIEFLSYQSFLTNKKSKKVIDDLMSPPKNSLVDLNLAGIDLGNNDLSTNSFLDKVFEAYNGLRMLNMSWTNVRSVRSYEWPRTIETIDLSFNRLDSFDCKQFVGAAAGYMHLNRKTNRLRNIYLNNNQMTHFAKFIESCSVILNKPYMTSSDQYPLEIDLRHNLFESIDNVASLSSTGGDTNHIHQDLTRPTIINENNQCHTNVIKSSLRLADNPLICNCENNWWSHIKPTLHPNLFQVNNTYCLSIIDYTSLRCRSISLLKDHTISIKQPTTKSNLKWTMQNNFQPIRADLIAPVLICPYEYSCSADTCECCAFKECDCAFHCPDQCTCARDFSNTFDIVNCTDVHLTSVPSYLPVSTTNLQLRENQLKRIQPYEFFGRFNLAKLDLSHNQLGYIEDKSFHGLSRLDTLKMSHNQLQILLGTEFKDLTNLEVLLLDNNRIQFISNVTFSYLYKLKYLNLKNNFLRHMLDHGKYFHFNPKLITLNMDKAVGSELIFPSGDDSYKDAIEPNTVSLAQRIEQGLAQNDTYFNLLKRHSRPNESSYTFIACLFAKFQNSLHARFSDVKPMFIYERVQSRFFKSILTKNLSAFRQACLKSEHSSLHFNAPVKANSEEKAPASSSIVVLNYTTIIWSSVIMLLALILFSSLLSILVFKLYRNSRRTTSKNSTFSPALIVDQKKDLYVTTQDPARVKPTKACMMVSFFTSLKQKINASVNYMVRKPKCVYQQANQLQVKLPKEPQQFYKVQASSVHSSISNPAVPHYYGPCNVYSNSKLYSHASSSRSDSLTSAASSKSKNSFSAASSSTLSNKSAVAGAGPKHDLFIVYNKVDSDLVHNIITPILKGKPYNFSIVLQHKINDRFSTTTTTTSLSSFTSVKTNQQQQKTVVTSSTGHLISYIRNSSLVLFVLSNNLFTDLECQLAAETPKKKKLAILADDIHESVAEQMLKPHKIFRGIFNVETMVFSFNSIQEQSEMDLDGSEYGFKECDLLSEFKASALKDNELEREAINRKIQLFNKEIQF